MSFATTAAKLIAKYGRSVDLVIYTDGTPPDPNSPWKIDSSTSVVQTVKAVFLSARRTKYGLPTDSQMDDGIPRNEEKLLLAAKDLAVKPNLKGIVRCEDGAIWIISSVQVVAPANDRYLYSLQVRQ